MRSSRTSMNSRDILKHALFYFILRFTSSTAQIISEIDVPELQLLASNLKPEECVRLVSFDSHTVLTDAQIEKLAREQGCFRRLVKWVCQLRTVTKNTYPIVNDLLERVGRRDLIECLTELRMKNTKSAKVIRDVQSVDDSEDYEGVTTATTSTAAKSKEKDSKQDAKSTVRNSNQTIEQISGHTAIRISLRTAGIVLITTILLTCCCTLFIRNRLARLCGKILGKKKKKGKLIPVNIEDERDVSRSYYVRKPRAKRKRAPSYEMVHTATQNTMVAVPKEPEEPSPTGCYRCYKKKRKKSARRSRR